MQANTLDRRDSENPPPLNIVHLEDNVHDREFVRRALNKAGIPCEFTYAENFEEFDAALSASKRNLILSDFTLPGYSGSAALAHARKHYPEIPYIFVSGTIGEERAVESLKGGATDYVLKHNLSRLPAAVEQATRAARESALRHQAEAALRESEKRFVEMAENIRDVFWISSPDGRVLIYVSPGYTHIWGRNVMEVHAHPDLWINSIVPEDRDRVLKAFATIVEGGEARIEYRISRPDDSVRWIETRAYPSLNDDGDAHAVGVSADITERKQLQQQLLQSQKMEAVGQLAGGVAHDFNNLLTVINGYASLVLSSESVPEEVKRPIERIAAAGDSAANLTRQLLVFSRQQSMQLRQLDLNRTIEESTRMLSRLIGENVELQLALDPLLPRIDADTGMIEQVLMNLVVNACDAMPSGGRLIVSTTSRDVSAADTRSHPSRRVGKFARLSVIDNGTGMTAEVMTKIFEPFFTTKEMGKGTGLGLAMVFGIVENHQGWIEMDSRVGHGSAFHIFLPVATAPAVHGSAPASEVVAGRGTETILLVEDDSSVRELTQTVLQNYGYNVVTAESASDALELWKQHGDRIRLLLTDVIMPDKMTGMELARMLRAAKPSLKVICMSGYNREVMARENGNDTSGPSGHEGMEFLQKPCPPQSLAKCVRDTLDKQATV